MKLEVREVSRTFAQRGRETVALLPTSFTVESGEFVSLLGPSGCGKSTLLGLIAGLDEASGGEVRIDGALVDGPGVDRGMVFQSYTLFPWLTVEENARFAFRLAANRGRAVDSEVDWLLELMGLADFRRAYPRELSGGMKQRVAIVRALANRPKVLLMDEPFGALDAQTREEMQQLMRLLQAHQRPTVLFVTHDLDEALYLSTRVLVLSARPGRIIADVPVPFGEERPLELKVSDEFLRAKRQLFNLLHTPRPPQSGRGELLSKLAPPLDRREPMS
jgi:NitT/TauT family transport system ATP-binding protein